MGSSLRKLLWLACAAAACLLLVARASSADTIQLSWDPNPESDVQGYVVYAGTSSGNYTFKQDVGPATSFLFPSAVAGEEYFFTVTAYNSAGESPQAPEAFGYSNVAPVLTTPADQVTAKGSSAALNLAGGDPWGDPVSFKATGLPPGLILTETTGMISGTPTASGTYAVAATVTDGVLSSTQSFKWTVTSSTPELLVDGSTDMVYYVSGPNTTFTINGVASGIDAGSTMWYDDNTAVRHYITPSPTWSVTINLLPGRNLVQAWLKDSTRHSGTVRVKVFYTP